LAAPLLLGLLGFVASACGGATTGAASPTGASGATAQTTGAPSVVVLPATGIVDSVLAGYLEEGVATAARDGAAAAVIRLNTPGGSLEATSRIVTTLLEAPLPVIVWVAPSGARAASAGTFITLAANVALMAPGTNIGAATPVGGQGEDIPGALGQKVLNDSVASIRSIAETRGRNADWAEQTVRNARSSPASEALAQHAIDGIAGSIEAVIAFVDGRTTTVRGQPMTIRTAGAVPVELGMNPAQGFLHLVSDPNIAFVLFTLGFYGLLFELSSPNFVTGILGGIAIVLAFVGFGSLPLNVAGVLLIVLAVILFILEHSVVSHGLLTIAGIACFALGASALYTAPGNPAAPAISVDPRIIVGLTAATAAYVLLVLSVVVRWRRGALLIGTTGPLVPAGTVAEVRTTLRPLGVVYASGEEWTARTEDGSSPEPGASVRVLRQDGLTLVVEPATLSD
jgi:membrane-bound serine protease (ClpP class)